MGPLVLPATDAVISVDRTPAPRQDEPVSGGEDVLHAPDGELLTHGRRVTHRAARPWLRRDDALVGVWPCDSLVEWVPAADRPAFAAQERRAEGRDCNVAGDVLLFRLADGRPVVVVQGPPC